MKQTAVEWYFTEIWNAPKDKFVWHSILEKAKQMEREQIIVAYDSGVWEVGCRNADSEQYYQETYGKNAWYHEMRGDKLSPQRNLLPIHGQAKRLPKLFY